MKEIKKQSIFIVVFLTMMLLWTGLVTTMAETTQTDSGTTSTETPQEKKSKLRIIQILN